MACQRAAPCPPEEEGDSEIRLRVVEKVRKILGDEAAERNREILKQQNPPYAF